MFFDLLSDLYLANSLPSLAQLYSIKQHNSIFGTHTTILITNTSRPAVIGTHPLSSSKHEPVAPEVKLSDPLPHHAQTFVTHLCIKTVSHQTVHHALVCGQNSRERLFLLGIRADLSDLPLPVRARVRKTSLCLALSMV